MKRWAFPFFLPFSVARMQKGWCDTILDHVDKDTQRMMMEDKIEESWVPNTIEIDFGLLMPRL